MSEKQNEVRAEETELNDEALEQVAGGCQIDSHLMDPPFTKKTSPIVITDVTY